MGGLGQFLRGNGVGSTAKTFVELVHSFIGYPVCSVLVAGDVVVSKVDQISSLTEFTIKWGRQSLIR